MAQISKTAIDNALRIRVFEDLFNSTTFDFDYQRINDRQYGVILTDLNGVERYVRIGVIVAEERDGMTARELMQSEIDKYQTAQANKAERAAKAAEKAAADKARREARAAEKAAKEKEKAE